MKATRHNGRSGKHGSYNPKHNDRQFDISHSEHIDGELALQNVYWDCYGGRRTSAETPENDESFEEVELRFYHDNYQDYLIMWKSHNQMPFFIFQNLNEFTP